MFVFLQRLGSKNFGTFKARWVKPTSGPNGLLISFYLDRIPRALQAAAAKRNALMVGDVILCACKNGYPIQAAQMLDSFVLLFLKACCFQHDMLQGSKTM